jgi:hypothetical protein
MTSKPNPRPDRPEWTAANAIGDAGEQAVAALFRKIGMAVEKMTDRCADLQVAGKIEVKTDRQALRTGNIAVEILHHGRPSGINTTCADAWAFVLTTGEVVLVKTDALRNAIARLPDMRAGEDATIRLLPLADLRLLAVSVGGRGR